jgi:MFS family permease
VAAIGPPIGRRSIGRSAARHTGIISGREVGTTAIALLPTYEAAGVGASVLLLLVRLFQGFSVGGEYTGSVVYLVETAPPGRRGFAGGNLLHGTQARNCKIHHLIPLHSQVTLMWKWY